MNRDDLFNKVDWEGGILETLEYGVTSADLSVYDPKLREAWDNLELAWHTFRQAEEMVADLLNQPHELKDPPDRSEPEDPFFDGYPDNIDKEGSF